MNGGQGKRLAVFVASTFIDEVRAELTLAFDATFAERGGDPVAELITRSGRGEHFDAVIFSLDVPMGSEVIRALPRGLRALATYSVGTDHVDLGAAADRGLAVFNTPGVLADSVAENAIFLMLGAARRATESIALLRSRSWSGWNPTQLVGVQLSGRSLGILGMGDIGERIARRASALGMEILYCNRRPLPEGHPLAEGYRATAGELVAESDILMLACPSTEETRRIVDDALLSRAKAGMILVNIARGDVVDDDALVDALREGRVWAAGLDVFAGEPKVDARYFDFPNVFMVPHIGSSTIEARLGMGRILIEGLSGWEAGGEVRNRVA
ncbi:MAG: NAD(P)-binding domain-containing protein [bacterium]|nr:D-glycerate dehydrogenase [Deltaproteobacteria bacterium]MCP4905816.1 NAD(P)-binding domain-containing protein [bacterium]